jgi:predicted  nucleic acid-binding Zn-ribbon protein
VATLNAEVEGFRQQCARYQQAEAASRLALQEQLQPALASLRRELHAAEAEFEQLGPRLEEELRARTRDTEREADSLRAALRAHQEKWHAQRAAADEKKEALEEKHVVIVSYFLTLFLSNFTRAHTHMSMLISTSCFDVCLISAWFWCKT